MGRMKTVCSLVIGLAALSCSKKEETAQPVAPQQPYPGQQYPQQQYPQQQNPQQPYPQQQYPQQPGTAPTTTPAPATTGTAPAAGTGQMAVPGPLALACQNDSGCGLARCNVQYQKCAFPCQTQNDCQPGNSCNTMSGLCLPGGGQ